MFDDITDPEKNPGFFRRHFSRVTHADVAKDEAQLIATVFTALAAFAGIVSVLHNGLVNAPVPVLLAVLAGLLRVSMSRVAALILLSLSILSLPSATAVIWILLAARATQLTFAYHRLSKAS